MRRGFFRLWVVITVLWAAAWIGIGVESGLVATPAYEIAPADRANLGLSPDASDKDVTLAILKAGSRGTRPQGRRVGTAFYPVGALTVAGLAVSMPLLLLAIGWAFARFSGPTRRNRGS